MKLCVFYFGVLQFKMFINDDFIFIVQLSQDLILVAGISWSYCFHEGTAFKPIIMMIMIIKVVSDLDFYRISNLDPKSRFRIQAKFQHD